MSKLKVKAGLNVASKVVLTIGSVLILYFFGGIEGGLFRVAPNWFPIVDRLFEAPYSIFSSANSQNGSVGVWFWLVCCRAFVSRVSLR